MSRSLRVVVQTDDGRRVAVQADAEQIAVSVDQANLSHTVCDTDVFERERHQKLQQVRSFYPEPEFQWEK